MVKRIGDKGLALVGKKWNHNLISPPRYWTENFKPDDTFFVENTMDKDKINTRVTESVSGYPISQI